MNGQRKTKLDLIGIYAVQKDKKMWRVNEMLITGGQEYIYMPSEGSNKSKQYVAQTTQGVIVPNIKWSIISNSEGISIDKEGFVAINTHFRVGDINGKDVVIRAINMDDSIKVAEISLHVREPQQLISYELSSKDSIVKGQTVEIAIAHPTDQYGEAFQAVDALVIKWVTSDNSVMLKGKELTIDQESQVRYAGVRAKVRGLKAEKRFIVLQSEKDIATNEYFEKLKAEQIIYNEGAYVDFTQTKEVDCKKYIYINKDVSHLSELKVDVTGFMQYAKEALYQVTIQNNDGSILQEDCIADAQGKVVVKLHNAVGVEVTSILRLSFGGNTYTQSDGYMHIAYNEKYDGKNDYGFYGIVLHTDTGVDLLDTEGVFTITLPDGRYDFVITKGGLARSTIQINGTSVGTNVGNGGTGRIGITPYVHKVYDIAITGGTARISMDEKDYNLAAVEIRRASGLKKRRTHIFIGGDSTASNYYPLETYEPIPGELQTGWGQVFKQFVTDELVVHNLAGGGTYAKSWYEMAFPGVIANGEAGDYFLIQEGVNDRTYSNREEMVQYLSYMLDECREKGIIPILVTAIQSVKFWKNASGHEVGEYDVPEGSSLAGFMERIRTLAKEKQVLFVDNGKICGAWYSKVGRTYVTQNYQIYNHSTNAETDTLHLSYVGAKKIAEFITTDIARQIKEGVKDCNGNTFTGIKLNGLTEYVVEHKNSTGENVKTNVTGVKSVYKKYA